MSAGLWRQVFGGKSLAQSCGGLARALNEGKVSAAAPLAPVPPSTAAAGRRRQAPPPPDYDESLFHQ